MSLEHSCGIAFQEMDLEQINCSKGNWRSLEKTIQSAKPNPTNSSGNQKSSSPNIS